jgi:hypothetical protein
VRPDYGAAVEYETDIMGVWILCALRNEAHPLSGYLQQLLLAGTQVSREQEPDLKTAEPIAVAPSIPRISSGMRGQHRQPLSVGARDVRKRDAKICLISSNFVGEQIERVA